MFRPEDRLTIVKRLESNVNSLEMYAAWVLTDAATTLSDDRCVVDREYMNLAVDLACGAKSLRERMEGEATGLMREIADKAADASEAVHANADDLADRDAGQPEEL